MQQPPDHEGGAMFGLKREYLAARVVGGFLEDDDDGSNLFETRDVRRVTFLRDKGQMTRAQFATVEDARRAIAKAFKRGEADSAGKCPEGAGVFVYDRYALGLRVAWAEFEAQEESDVGPCECPACRAEPVH